MAVGVAGLASPYHSGLTVGMISGWAAVCVQESRAGYVGSLGCLPLGSLGNSAWGTHAFPLVESGEDYVNVPESEESADASLSEWGDLPGALLGSAIPPSVPLAPSPILTLVPSWGGCLQSPAPCGSLTLCLGVLLLSHPLCDLSPFGCGCPSF